MKMVTWSPDMCLGQSRLDAAHESFVCDLGKLDETNDEDFCAAFCRAIAQSEKDFRVEEAMMEEIDYPGLHVHREQHARVLGALHQVAGRVMQGDIAMGRRAALLLSQWFVLHLSTMDTALALAMELHQVESADLQARPVA